MNRVLRCAGFTFDTQTPRIMAILNATPDSFSGDGMVGQRDVLLRRAECALKDGAAAYLSKERPPTDLVAAVRRGSQGTLPALAVGFLAALLVYTLHGMVDGALYSQRTYVLASVVFGAMALVSIDLLTSNRPVGPAGPASD